MGSVRFGWSRSAQVLFHRDFEVHQLGALGVTYSGQKQARAGKRSRDTADIEEHESRLGGVRLHGLGGELCVLKFFERLRANRTFYFLGGKGQRRGLSAGGRAGK